MAPFGGDWGGGEVEVGKGKGGGVERVLELKRQKKKKVASSETTEGGRCLNGGGSL